jgi:hypothetical protein
MSGHALVVGRVVRNTRLANALPHLVFGPIVDGQPGVHDAASAAGGLIAAQAHLPEAGARFLRAQAHAVQHTGGTVQLTQLGHELSDQLPGRASLLIRSAVAS